MLKRKRVKGWKLSPQQDRILRLLLKGFNVRQISEKLGIAYNTVRAHLSVMYQKANVTDRSSLVIKALRKKEYSDET